MIGLVHLVWAPLGTAPLRRFLASYRAHSPGADHELGVVLNGASSAAAPEGSREALEAEIAETDHRLIVLEEPVLDLAAYGEAARRLEHSRLCFVNSYTVVQADGWLGALSRALDEPDVGLVGASGSWESQAEWVRGSVLHWPQQLLTLRSARRDFPRFPNPHIRTTGFMIERAPLLEMRLDRVRDKRSAYLLESGRISITRRVQQRGQRAVVVGRDRCIYDIADWPASRTFRSDGQGNLLVADNRTEDFEAATPALRRRLARDAWG
jgi:hypothetical protein